MFQKKFSSIRWRIVFIYTLLVFIAMTILSVFIMNELENYYFDSRSERIDDIISKTQILTSNYENLSENPQSVQEDIEAWGAGINEELHILGQNGTSIIASTKENLIGKKPSEVLSSKLILSMLNSLINGEDSLIILDNEILQGEDIIRVRDFIYPIQGESGTLGFLYIRSNMEDVYDSLTESKFIFIRGMLISLAITVILGFLIARSITVPINKVTEKAEKMSQGDFSQVVEVMSNDEIGRLAEMFNLLREKLDFTLSEISSEKSKLETILKYMADGLIAVNLNGRIIHANPAAMQMLRLGEEDIKYKRYDEIILKYTNKLTLRAMKEHSENWEGVENFDYEGNTFYAKYARFKDENGKDLGIVMLLQDITEQQLLENMQREFVANVSHELKTPLTTIKSYTETLIETEPDQETTTNFLKIVDMEADRMSRLVRDLLQLSRLDYNKEKWNKKPFDLISILETVYIKMELTAKNKGLSFIRLFSEDMEAVAFLDKDRMEQVILNVLSNAIKYTGEGGEVSMDLEKTDKHAVILIKDTGTGIPEKDLPFIFDRFYRVDKARSRAMGGTGLGLSIAKQIVEGHNGSIEINSKENMGTEISITIPLLDLKVQQE